MSYQTTIQNQEAVKKGSTRVLIGDDFDSLVDIGVITEPNLDHLIERQEIEFDNAKSLKRHVKGKRFSFNFTLHEINLTNIQKLNDGLISLETEDGTEVSGAEQNIGSPIEANIFYKIENQNGDGTEITVNSVTGSEDGALSAQDGFSLVKNAQGEWGIVFSTVAGSELTTLDQSFVIDYDYTPSVSKKITFSDTGNAREKVMRITNTNEDNKTFKIDIENGTNFTPVSLDFAGDEEPAVASMPIEFQGDIVDFIDEQQVT